MLMQVHKAGGSLIFEDTSKCLTVVRLVWDKSDLAIGVADGAALTPLGC